MERKGKRVMSERGRDEGRSEGRGACGAWMQRMRG